MFLMCMVIINTMYLYCPKAPVYVFNVMVIINTMYLYCPKASVNVFNVMDFQLLLKLIMTNIKNVSGGFIRNIK
jgi:hypothetical protein